MADTIANIDVPAGEWLDLYDEASIAVGIQLLVENIGVCDVSLAVQATQPNIGHEAFNFVKRNGIPLQNHAGDSGAWAFCNNQDGKLNVSIVSNNGFIPARPENETRLIDHANRSAMVSLPGELHTGFKNDDITVNFQYGISKQDIKDGGSSSGTGSVGHAGSNAFVSSGTGVGTALLESRRAIRYLSGHECHGAQSIVFGTPEANVNQYAGFLNAEDGWAPGYQGLSFGIWFIEGGNINFIKQIDFNIDKLDGFGSSGYNINPQTDQTYRTTYTWHGVLDMTVEIYIGMGRWVAVHTEVFVNVATEPHLENPNLPLALKVERLSGTGSDIIIKTGSWRGGTIGAADRSSVSDRWFPDFVLNRTKTNSATRIDHLLTLRSKDIFQGKINHIKTEVKILVSTNATNKDLVFVATRLSALDSADQATIIAGMADINTDDSVIESSDVALLLTAIPESSIGDVAVVASAGQRDNLDVQGFDIYPGEDTVFGVLGAANGTVSFQMNFKELH